MFAMRTDGLPLLWKKVVNEVRSLESEGYRFIGQAQLYGVTSIHLYHGGNGNGIFIKVYKTFAVVEKNRKMIKVIKE